MNIVGTIRRSQIVSIYGPGAIVNLKYGDASISVVMGDLDSWDLDAAQSKKYAKKDEPRLRKALEADNIKISSFRLPPVGDKDDTAQFSQSLIAQIFPKVLICPNCRTVKKHHQWISEDQYGIKKYCPKCQTNMSANKKSYVVPSRFVVACKAGHMQDLDYQFWLNQKLKEKNQEIDCEHKNIKLTQDGDGLGISNLKLICLDCKSTAGMNDIFSQEFKCFGMHPWKSNAFTRKESCSLPARVVQRNSKSLWTACRKSLISIPPWKADLPSDLIVDLHTIQKMKSKEDRYKVIELQWESHFKPICLANSNYDMPKSIDEFKNFVDEIITQTEAADPNLKKDEFKILICKDDLDPNPHFEKRNQDIKKLAKKYNFIDMLVSVPKLREVSALYGFRRMNGEKIVFLNEGNSQNWLPISEMHGEGIFISIKEEIVKKVVSEQAPFENLKELDTKKKRLALLHSLSHLLIQSLAEFSGYSLSSIKERIYFEEGQHGILIYTSSSDSEGTLGGLSRLAQPKRFEIILEILLQKINYCSNDPICGHGLLSSANQNNGSACHACTLLPETSCEYFNEMLCRNILKAII
jgi:hypothetical protein